MAIEETAYIVMLNYVACEKLLSALHKACSSFSDETGVITTQLSRGRRTRRTCRDGGGRQGGRGGGKRNNTHNRFASVTADNIPAPVPKPKMTEI